MNIYTISLLFSKRWTKGTVNSKVNIRSYKYILMKVKHCDVIVETYALEGKMTITCDTVKMEQLHQI